MPTFEHELVNDSIITRTMDGIIRFWNQSAEKLYGWKKDEAVGKVSHSLLQTEFPEALESIESELVQKGVWQGKLVHTTRDGGRLVVESRWILNSEARSREVVEINTVATSLKASPDNYSREIGRRRLASKSISTEKFLITIANIILAGGGLFCLLVLSYFVYQFSWTGERYFTSSLGMVVYYVLPVILGGLLFASIKLPAPHKIRLALVLCSISFSVYSIETMLSFSHIYNVSSDRIARAKVAQESGVAFDSRSTLQVITDLRAKGIDAYPDVASSWLMQRDERLRSKTGEELWPLASISNKVSVLCNEGGDYLIHKSDEHGFHNPTGIWRTGKIDVAAVGDSYTQGWCVPSDKNFVALVRERYPLTLNLGVHGNGPLTQLATIEEYLPSLRPRIVLWFYHEGTDPKDLKSEKDFALLMKYLDGTFTQGLSGRQLELDRILTAYIEEEIRKSALTRNLEQVLEQVRNQGLLSIIEPIVKLTKVRGRLGLIGPFGAEVNVKEAIETEFWEVEDLFRQVLLQANTTVGEWGGKLYFVYLPDFRTNWENVREDREEVLRVVSKLGIPVIDVHRAFQMRSDRDPPSLFPFRLPGHYNVEGHRLVAETVLQSISGED